MGRMAASTVTGAPAVRAMRDDEFVAIATDRDPASRLDLALAAELASDEQVNTMATLGGGIVYVALSATRCRELLLPPQAALNDPARWQTSATVSVEARVGTTTGISAGDRAHTIRILGSRTTTAGDLVRPGHVFPLSTRDTGVFGRAGSGEAAVDLARVAGREPAVAMCEVLRADGRVATVADLADLLPGVPLVTIGEVIALRVEAGPIIERGTRVVLPIHDGVFAATGYASLTDGRTHLALTLGDASGEDLPVAVLDVCLIGGALGGQTCECAALRDAALAAIAAAGRGALISLESTSPPAVCPRSVVRTGLPAEAIAAAILMDLGITSSRRLPC